VFEYFPGNYRWSMAVLGALRSGAVIGELDQSLRKLREASDPTDEDWASAWADAGDQQVALAAQDVDRGFEISAGERLLRATLYYLQGERQLAPGGKKSEAYRRGLDSFEQGVRLAHLPFERVEVDSPDGPLPGIFIRAPGEGPHPVMLFFDGFDITKELMAISVRDVFARRGISCLAVDSPGVGEPLRLRGVPSRPDYEVPAGCFIDYLETRDDVDTERIAVMGVSLGGYYSPRAAAFEPRIKACVAWGAILDYGATWKRRWETRSDAVPVPFHQLPWVMGTDTMEAALERVQQWTLIDVLPKLTLPFLMLHGENDKQVPLADAHTAFDLVASDDKELRVFTETDGGAEHCQVDGGSAALNYIADWAAEKLCR
jgi:dienelactone hydrolase